jgi:RHS repeat-associated protein
MVSKSFEKWVALTLVFTIFLSFGSPIPAYANETFSVPEFAQKTYKASKGLISSFITWVKNLWEKTVDGIAQFLESIGLLKRSPSFKGRPKKTKDSLPWSFPSKPSKENKGKARVKEGEKPHFPFEGEETYLRPKKGEVELVEKRTKHTKTFKGKDGDFKTYVFREPIHYKDNKGNWQEINNKLKPSGSKSLAYKNTAGLYEAYFASKARSFPLVQIKFNGEELSFSLNRLKPKPDKNVYTQARNVNAKVEGNKITYAGVYPFVDLTYQVGNSFLKENIVVKKYTGKNKFSFIFQATGLTFKQDKEGYINFFKEGESESLFCFEKPYAFDSNLDPSTTNDVYFKIVKRGSYYQIDLTVDKAWLESPSRVYPVTVDPTVKVQPGSSAGQDAFISSRYPNDNYANTTYLKAGYNPNESGKSRSFIKFSNAVLPSLGSGYVIQEATFYIYNYGGWKASNRIDLRRVKSSWSESSITWNNQPSVGSREASYAKENYGWYSFDVTDLVKDWYSGDQTNYGLRLNARNEQYHNTKLFRSCEYGTSGYRPYLVINYNNRPSTTAKSPSGWVTTARPTFTWTYSDANSDPIKNSRLQIATDKSFNNIVRDIYPGAKTSYTLPENKALESGTYWWRVRVSDGKNWSYWSNKLSMRVDLLNPTCSITSPSKDTWVEGVVSIVAQASDDSGVSKVSFYYRDANQVPEPNWILIGTDSNSSNGWSISWDTTELNDGSYSLAAVATDLAGRTNAKDPTHVVKKDTIPPEAHISSPSSGEVVSNVVTILGTAFDTNLDYYRLEYGEGDAPQEWLKIDEDKTSSIVDGELGTWETASIPDGTYTLRLTVRDKASHIKTATSLVQVKNKPVEVIITSPTEGSYVRETVEIEGEIVNGIPIDRVEFYVDGSLVETTTSPSETFKFTWESTTVQDGPHAIEVKSYDYLSRVSTDSVNVIVDNTAPTVVINSPAEGATLKGNVSVSASSSDELSGVATMEFYALRFGYYFIYYGAVETTSYTWLWDTTLDADGTYFVIILAADKAGNIGLASVEVEVENLPYGLGYEEFWSMNSFADGDIYVNNTNGNLVIQSEDLAIPSPGFDTVILRTYNSQAKRREFLGWGWFFNYSPSLSEESDGSVILTDEDGSKHKFTKNPDNTYKSPPGIFSRLVKKEDGSFSLISPDGTVDDFDKLGRLVATKDTNGNTLTFHYNFQNLLTKVTDAAGRETHFTYDENGYLTKVKDVANREISYSYDEAGNLTTVIDPAGNQTTYTYDENHNLKALTDAEGHTTTFAYTEDGKLETLTDGDGNTVTYTYNPEAKETQMKDPEGGTYTYKYDENGCETAITDPLGQTSTFTYDENCNMVSETDPKGTTERYEYDENGNMTKLIDSLGNTSTYTYDENNNLVSATDANGNTFTFTYDSSGNLLQEIDPEGNVVKYEYDDRGNVVSEIDALGRETKYEYDETGNLVSATDPKGNTTTYTYDVLGNVLTETQPNGAVTELTYDINGNLITETDPLGYTITYTYDALGNEISETDGNGNTTTFEYDAAGNLVKETDPLGHSITYTYDAFGNEKTMTDENGHTTTFEYDALGRLVKETDPLGYTSNFEYDSADNLVAETDPNGNRTTYVYDSEGQILYETNPEGGIVRYQYDPNGNLISETDENGYTTYFKYDALDRLVEEENPLGAVEKFTYDAEGNEIAYVDENGSITTYTYDENNNVISQKDALGNETTATYDSVGNLTSITDPNGNTTKYTNDLNGNILAITDALGGKTSFSYDSEGNIVSATDPEGNVTTFSYNENGDLTSITDPSGNVVTFNYDPAGNLVTQTDENGNTTTYEYDALDRIISETDPSGGVTQYTYDGNGNLVSVTDPNGNATTYVYDGLDQLIKTIDPEGNITTFTYNPAGDLISVTDPNGNVTTYTYDALGQLISEKDASGNVTTYEYDPAGNLLSVTDPNGQTTSYELDALGRVVKVIYPDGSTVTLTYDANGNLLTLTDESGTTTYTYDALNRLVKVEYPSGEIIEYTYDKNGNVTSKTIDGKTTYYNYDENQRLVEIVDGDGNTYTYTYEPNGNLSSKTTPDSLTATYTYDETGRLLSKTLTNDTGEVVLSFEYVLDKNGNRISVTTEEGTTKYTYDARGQLVSVLEPSGRLTEYTYDAAGNCLEKTVTINYSGPQDQGKKIGITEIIEGVLSHEDFKGKKKGIRENIIGILDELLNDNKGGYQGEKKGLKRIILEVISGKPITAATYTYNSLGQLTQVHNPISGKTINQVYDANGNLVKSEETTYAYDSNNLLIKVESPQDTVSFTYDTQGRRTSKTTSKGTVKYLYDGNQLLEEIDENGETIAQYNWDANGLTSFTYQGKTYFFHTNGHGDVVAITDEEGKKVASYTYDAWGRVLSIKGSSDGDNTISDFNSYLYCGQFGVRYDKETGLYHMGVRYYNPIQGRFLSKDPELGDPTDPLTFSPYIYCKNNPVNFVDPQGTWPAFLDRVVRKVTRSYSSVRRTVRSVVRTVKHRARRTYRKIKRRVTHVYKKVKRTVRSTYRRVRRTYYRVKRTVHRYYTRAKRTYHRVKKRIRKTVKKAYRRTKKIAGSLYRKARTYYRKGRKALKNIGKWGRRKVKKLVKKKTRLFNKARNKKAIRRLKKALRTPPEPLVEPPTNIAGGGGGGRAGWKTPYKPFNFVLKPAGSTPFEVTTAGVSAVAEQVYWGASLSAVGGAAVTIATGGTSAPASLPITVAAAKTAVVARGVMVLADLAATGSAFYRWARGEATLGDVIVTGSGFLPGASIATFIYGAVTMKRENSFFGF